MARQLKISIVTPSFNQGEYIEQTIDSVLSQNYPNLEYVIIDGGSTDSSIEVIRKYEKYLHFWISEPDKGQSHAINKGLNHLTGDVFNWLNSDDFYEQDTFSKVNEYFQDSKVNCLCGKSNLLDRSKVLQQSPGTDLYPRNLAKTIGWSRIDQPETFFRTNTVQKMGSLNQNFRYVMDREWWIRYLLLFGLDGVKKTNDILVNFRLHQDSKTVSESDGFLEESYQLWSDLTEQVEPKEVSKFFQSLTKKKEGVLDKSFYKTLKNQDIITPSAHYALLYLADFFYYNGNLPKSKQALSLIDPSYLGQDKLLFDKLKFRNSIPFLKTAVNYFRGN